MISKHSISGIKLFKACRRAYQLKYVFKVVPKDTSEALETGLRYHEMIEQFETSGKLPELDSKEAAMAIAYARYIHKDMPKFQPEKWFEFKPGRSKRLVGRLDGKADGAIVEHKTTSVSSIDEYEYDLQGDEQLLAYMLATGARLAYYTICRKPTIRQKQNETDEEFAQRCLDWYAEDTYNKIRLVMVSRTDEQINNFHLELNKMFRQIDDCAKHDLYYRNTCNCNAWGRKCEYAPICLDYDPNQEYVNFERSE